MNPFQQVAFLMAFSLKRVANEAVLDIRATPEGTLLQNAQGRSSGLLNYTSALKRPSEFLRQSVWLHSPLLHLHYFHSQVVWHHE